jgi:hypothetical protein
MPPAQTRSVLLAESSDAIRAPKNGRKKVRVRWLLPLTLSIVIGFVASCFPASAASPILFGGVGNVASLSKASGVTVPENRYARLNANPPNTRMINLMPSSNWATVAAAQPGSATYNNLLRWANTLKARGTPVWLAFSHEPEAHASRSLGNNTQFIAAFRKVVTVMRSTGEHNIQFVWQMTSYAFQVKSSDARSAPKWYPGSAYVDLVGADPYNWYTCGSGRGQWVELSQVAGAALNFARSQGKGLVLGEYGSMPGSRRAQWLRNAGAWARANANTVRGMFYFDIVSSDCKWQLTSSADLSAFANGVVR